MISIPINKHLGAKSASCGERQAWSHVVQLHHPPLLIWAHFAALQPSIAFSRGGSPTTLLSPPFCLRGGCHVTGFSSFNSCLRSHDKRAGGILRVGDPSWSRDITGKIYLNVFARSSALMWLALISFSVFYDTFVCFCCTIELIQLNKHRLINCSHSLPGVRMEKDWIRIPWYISNRIMALHCLMESSVDAVVTYGDNRPRGFRYLCISVKTAEWAVEMMSTPVIMPLNGYWLFANALNWSKANGARCQLFGLCEM